MSKREIGCTASNEYFMKFFGMKERQVQYALSTLKERGLIKEIGFDGRRRHLKSINPKNDSSEVHLRGAEKCTPQMQKSAPLPKPLYKEDNKEDSSFSAQHPAPQKAPPQKRKKTLPAEKREVEKGVWITDLEKTKLVEKLGEGGFKQVCEELSVWKDKKGIAGGDDYRSLINWSRSSSQSPSASTASPSQKSSPTKKNKEIAESICRAYKGNSYASIDTGTYNISFSNNNVEVGKDKYGNAVYFHKDLDMGIPQHIFIEEVNKSLRGMRAPFQLSESGEILA